jgi:hypothetical protein
MLAKFWAVAEDLLKNARADTGVCPEVASICRMSCPVQGLQFRYW